MGFSLVLLQTAGWLKQHQKLSSAWTTSASFTKALFYLFGSLLVLFKYLFRASSSASLSAKRPTITFQMQEITHHNQSNQYNPVPGDKHPFTLNTKTFSA
ncbi:hypothetical protein BANRA_00008 [Escherichia coli]|nr:hypothetical protein BANRA_00008 [Escherichia coli]